MVGVTQYFMIMKNLKKQTPHPYFRHLFGLIIFFLLSVSKNFAAVENPGNNAPTEVTKEQWVFHSEVQGVKVYYQVSTCQNNSVVYLKFDNTNNRSVRITWKEVFITKQVPEEREGILGQKQLTLAPGITSQSDCAQINIKECVTLAYQALPAYKADIVKFNLKDISVTNPS